ncbi:glycerol-3-phosphate 1-O-acyltransferase PlsY [Polymorphobacter fuscus]|uniref:Glycerol-3-phosphate acyltransferase n=1 Tax=Sandarakinorhabdus fusca TaxID=1439888 RepID=A0A7C9GQT8_9SPHN|nr:glycerol-3-phosphate 1-O-acyltransferase PlsY [Polymorphobacter fuscus]KAB7647406.1 glycerol-3-phosphate 1-O-acyltransferase PlsY [Polymorphobacter fuscus]MQT16651.1 glycerol-3-phosphate 1-O-acyltransferase PlsY [Polymorphobacter fuscus]NJC09364.1 glycerol-3-phosphate acyltransferase PlsY [Polymorphobacter fuscus]
MGTTSLLWIGIGYLLGSIPFGLLLTRAVGVDIRTVGSGNIGTTNVLRTGNKGLAAATLLLDAGKGAVAVLLARQFGGVEASMLAGVAAFLGHCYPVWLGFKGGKGVATLLGVTLAAVPVAGVIALIVWAAGAALTRYSSVGGLLAAVAAPVAAALLGFAHSAIALALMAAVLVWKHRDNIARLRAGTESRIGAK